MMIIVAVDSNDDDVAAACLAYRRSRVYPALRSRGFAIRALVAGNATRAAVTQALADPDVVLVCGSGHGLPARFAGQTGEPLLEVGADQAAEPAGKMSHLLACFTGQALGPDLVANGCVAFFGYDGAFVVPLGSPAALLECDGVIDREIAAGRTARAVYERAHRAFTIRIQQLLAAKQPYLAAVLEYNRDHLCAPSTDPRWGDPDATI